LDLFTVEHEISACHVVETLVFLDRHDGNRHQVGSAFDKPLKDNFKELSVERMRLELFETDRDFLLSVL
jgi:hypothetical protein